jgi:hypothetical protein
MRRLLLGLALLLAAAAAATPAASFATTTTSASAATPAGHVARGVAAVPVPRTPKRLPRAIEPLAGYVEDTSCDLRIRPGTRRLASLLARTYRSFQAADWASTYTCGTDGTRSEHYDGRAIDWMVDVHNDREHAAAKAFLALLLAPDRFGNADAMARRLGVMYVIYDNRMWGAWDGRWEDYNGCSHLPQPAYANSCHRTHMHISLSWDGAMGRTSFWTHRVPALTDYGPCRLPGLAWAHPYWHRNVVPCPSVAAPVLGPHPSATKRALAAYSGIALHRGMTGPAVDAVQAALGVTRTDRFDGPTARAMWRFERGHHLAVTRVLRAPAWLALLAATH